MLTERQSRISILARTNSANAVSTELLSRLSTIFNHEVETASLISIESSDAIREQHFRGYKNGLDIGSHFLRLLKPQDGWSSIIATIEKLETQLGHEAVVLIPSHFEQCVRVTLRETLSRTADMLNFDRDTLNIASEDGHSGLMLDWNPDDPKWTFELAIWGESWTKVVA